MDVFKVLKVTAISLVTILILCSCSNGSSNNSAPQLAFSVQPASNSTPTGTNNYIKPGIQVMLLDANGNQDSTAAAVAVTLSISKQPNADLPLGGIYAGSLIGKITALASHGMACFESVSLTQPGNGYTLTASAPGYKSVTSTPFKVNSSLALAEAAGYKSTAAGNGYEVAYIGGIGMNYQGNVYVYIDYGTNPITSDTEFNDFNCGESWVKNTPRHATFDYANTLGSPMVAPGALTLYTDCQGHTWGLIVVNISYMWPYDPSAYPSPPPIDGWQAAQTSNYVPAGEVKYSSINKNQLYLFTKTDSADKPILRHLITDPWGNIYMMKSTNLAYTTPAQIAAAFASSVLPAGWSKTSIYLAQDLYAIPAYNYYGGESFPSALSMDIRDSADNGYSLLYWSNNGNSVPQQAEPSGVLPLFVTEGGGSLHGTPSNDQMWGSFGDDVFYPYAGNDVIDGGLGLNSVVFELSSSLYAISTSNGVTTVSGADGVKTLTNIQQLQFSDKYFSL